MLIVSGLYSLSGVALAWAGPHRWQTYLLGVQICLLLPAFILILRKDAGVDPRSRPSLVPPWAFAVASAALIGVFVYFAPQWHFGVAYADETAYLFQAKIYRTAAWYTEPLPVLPELPFTPEDRYFDWTVEHEGKWFTQYPPGWPLILAGVGSLLPDWLVNPLLALVLLSIVYRMEREFVGNRFFPFTVVAACLSPFFLAFAVGLMSHISCAIFTALATMWVLKGLDRWPHLIGVLASLAAVCIIRPGVGAAIGPVLVAAAAWELRSDRSSLVRFFLMGSITLGGTLAFLGWNNWVLTGDPLTSPYSMAFQRQNPEASVSFAQVLVGFDLTKTRWALQATWLHSFPLLLPLAAVGTLNGGMSKFQRITLAALFLSMVLLNSFNGLHSGGVLGERYYFESFFALLLLSASGWRHLLIRWRLCRRQAQTAWSAICFLAFLHIVLFLNLVQERLFPYYEVVRVAEGVPLENGVVFLSDNHAAPPKHLNRNDPDWKHSPRIYLPDPGVGSRKSVTEALGRTSYIVVGFSAKEGRGVLLEGMEFGQSHEPFSQWSPR